MSKRLSILVIAALIALVGMYQLAPTQADDQELNRSNCVEGQKCG